MNFITYIEKDPVNLDYVLTFRQSRQEGKYVITFIVDRTTVVWSFDSRYECDCVYRAVVARSYAEAIFMKGDTNS